MFKFSKAPRSESAIERNRRRSVPMFESLDQRRMMSANTPVAVEANDASAAVVVQARVAPPGPVGPVSIALLVVTPAR